MAHDKPEKFISKLIDPSYVNTIVYQQETCSEELEVEDKVRESAVKVSADVDLVGIWGATLHHIDDLPYDPHEEYPHVYGNARKKEAHVHVRPLLPSPQTNSLPFVDLEKAKDFMVEASEYLPDLQTDLGFSKEEIKASAEGDPRGCYTFKGGEKAGLKRLN